MRMLMTGDEAIARGAYEAGVHFASAYPGTPSTEILQNMTQYEEVFAEWAPNEKVSLEAAAGASIAGMRAMCSMKHVGVNVAADPMFTFAYTGVNGGMVIVSADEPGMHSSQNEQDNRYYAQSSKIPMLEPSNSQECIDMMKLAFEISEEYDTPVFIRITTRIAHSKSVVELKPRVEVAIREYVKDANKFMCVPAVAAKLRVKVEARGEKFKEYTEKTPLNYIEKGGSIGVIASGKCVNFAKEVFGNDATYLKLGFTYPLPDKLLDEFYKQVDADKVYVIEENDPYLEHWVQRRGHKCIGKPTIPTYGELTPDALRAAIHGEMLPQLDIPANMTAPRPPVFCSGCPHRGFFYELAKRKNTVIAGDIGCYTLAYIEPYNAMDFVVCMSAAFSSGHGAQIALDKAGSDKRVVAVLGDSTFFHMGINGLIEVLYNGSKTICVVLDNRITGMTGGQEHPGTGKNAHGQPAHEMDIEAVCRALGAKNVCVVNPNDLAAVSKALDDAYAIDEPSVIITRWPCVLKPMGEADLAEFGQDVFKTKLTVDNAKCTGCKLCMRVGCPSISMIDDKDANKLGRLAKIENSCVGCNVCAQVCPPKAIVKA